MTMIFLDGKPGAGKNFVATNIFQEAFGYYHCDGDDALPELEINSIQQSKIPSHEMRQEHTKRILTSLKELSKEYSKIVITHAFMKNAYRELALKDISNAIFILVECEQNTRVKRLETRKNHLVTSTFAKDLDSEFEEPDFPYWTIYNHTDGVDGLMKQVSEFFRAVA